MYVIVVTLLQSLDCACANCCIERRGGVISVILLICIREIIGSYPGKESCYSDFRQSKSTCSSSPMCLLYLSILQYTAAETVNNEYPAD